MTTQPTLQLVAHEHQFEEHMQPDEKNDEVYYWGKCVICGEVDI